MKTYVRFGAFALCAMALCSFPQGANAVPVNVTIVSDLTGAGDIPIAYRTACADRESISPSALFLPDVTGNDCPTFVCRRSGTANSLHLPIRRWRGLRPPLVLAPHMRSELEKCIGDFLGVGG